MYTAESISKKIENGGLTVTVQFTDGKDTFTEDFYANSGMDESWLQRRVSNRLLALNTLVEFADGLTLGPIEEVSGEPEKSDAQQWVEDLALLKKMQTGAAIGVVETADLEAQEKKVKNTYKEEFIHAIPLM